MTTSSWRRLALAGLFAALALPVAAEEGGSSSEEPPPPGGTSQQSDGPSFGGPNAVENQLHEDKQSGTPFLDRIADWKSGLKDKHGVDLGIDYTAAYFGASDSPGEDQSGSGLLRFYGAWDLVGRKGKNTGALVWKAEHRHGYTDVPLFDFGFEIGYAGFIEPAAGSTQPTTSTSTRWPVRGPASPTSPSRRARTRFPFRIRGWVRLLLRC
jgi:hypothetical protein